MMIRLHVQEQVAQDSGPVWLPLIFIVRLSTKNFPYEKVVIDVCPLSWFGVPHLRG
jgi:hypothetical protein